MHFAFVESAYWPLGILGICVALIIVLITVFRIHAFLALITVAMVAGILAPAGTLPGPDGQLHWIRAVENTATELGIMAGKVGILIALASIIGVCVMESGAADKIVRRMLAIFGERHGGLAILTGGFLLGLPIFFDTLFMLLIPIARALRIRTGRDYTLYVLAICCAGAVTHSLVSPHPGPTLMAERLNVHLGWSVIAGTLAAILPVLFGWQVARWLNRRTDIPLRETAGAPLADLERIINKPERELPSFAASILPVLLPIFLISLAAVLDAFPEIKAMAVAKLTKFSLFAWFLDAFPEIKAMAGSAQPALAFIGNRNIALLIGAVLAMGLVMRQRGINVAALSRFLGPALETAGVIILITSAGGAFGGMLRQAGVDNAIRDLAAGREINYILLAWGIAVMLKFAQGSATVSLLTTATMMVGITQGADLPYHPMYLFLAIGFGGLGLSWMNDSGFWVIGRLSGFTEKETLRTWTVLAFAMSVAGLLQTLALATFLPFK